MINRKAYWISGILIALMFAAAIVRTMLLPDWTQLDWTQLPVFGAGGVPLNPRNPLWLFIAPASALFVAAVFAFQEWNSTVSKESHNRWGQWRGTLLVAVCLLVSVRQSFTILRSFGFGNAMDPITVARTLFVLLGVLVIVLGNQLPKLPWLESRIAVLRLNATQGARMLRFRGWYMVAFGSAIVVGGALLPMQFMVPFVLTLAFGGVAVTLLVRMQLKRHQHN